MIPDWQEVIHIQAALRGLRHQHQRMCKTLLHGGESLNLPRLQEVFHRQARGDRSWVVVCDVWETALTNNTNV